MRLRKERIKAGLTQRELGRRCELTQAAISKIESGQVLDPGFDTLSRIATVLQKCGRMVLPSELQPRRQPTLLKGFRSQRKRSRVA